MDFEPTEVSVCTYQAISGAGKTFETWPEMVDNVIPYIGGEEEKSEKEPMKIWGHIEGDHIESATTPVISAQCLRVACSDGHMAAASVKFKNKPSKEVMIRGAGTTFKGPSHTELNLPSAPEHYLTYFEEDNLRRPSWTATSRMVWVFPSVVCVKIPSLITSLSACRTTLCAAQQAALF